MARGRPARTSACEITGPDSVLVGMESSRRPVTSRQRCGGFTLVEVLVSCALLGLAAATLMSLLVRSGLNNLEARRADALAAMARSSLDELGNADNVEQVWCPSISAWRDDCGAEPPQFRRSVHAVPVTVPALAGESVEVEEVTVEVTALQVGRAAGERTIRLVTFRTAGVR